MTRKQIYLLIAGLALLLLLIAIPMWVQHQNAVPAATPQPTAAATATVQPTAEITPEPTPTATPESTPTPTPAPTATPYVPPVAPPVAVPEVPQYLTFPYAIPDTPLVIDGIKSYDGIFLEDGSDTPISGVASLILRNTGSQCVDYAEIQLTGTLNTMHFTLSGLQAGASMVVLEAGKTPAVQQNYLQAAADAALTDHFELSADALKIEETADGQLQVTNLTAADIPCVRVFYKFYMAPENVYVGGITYVVKIDDLKAGASAQVAPSHYAVGSSRVVMAKTYETSAE